jgi:hypothetical protein
MMIIKLLNIEWKEKIRSVFWQKSLWINILLGIACLYLIICVVSIGYFADKILSEIYKDRNVIQAFTGLLFYYFTFDLIMRFLVQKLPVISIQPYLTLPVKKSTLLHYPLLKTIPGFFNLLALCLILPFYFKTVLPTNSFVWSSVWLVTIISLIGINNYLGFVLKKYFVKRPLLIFLILALIVVLFYFDIKGKIDITEWLAATFLFLERHPRYAVIPPFFALCSYALSYLMLKRNSYIEEEKKNSSRYSPGFSFLSKYGETGTLMQAELRMIFRNKRPKSMIWVSLIFLLYGFIFYTPENINKTAMLIFAGFFVTTSTALFYGQFYFAWESSFFDAYIANKISISGYLKSKYWLFFMFCFICYVLTLPYGLFGHKIVLINLSMFIYNAGVSSFLYILFGTFNRSRIDLGKSQFMNYEGTSASQWISMIPILGLPFLIFSICSLLGNGQFTFYILAALGLLGIIFNEYILNMLGKLFLKNKYKLAVAFRKH